MYIYVLHLCFHEMLTTKLTDESQRALRGLICPKAFGRPSAAGLAAGGKQWVECCTATSYSFFLETTKPLAKNTCRLVFEFILRLF